MKLAIISFTKKGGSLNQKLGELFVTQGVSLEGYSIQKYAVESSLTGFSDIKKLTEEIFYRVDGIIFIGACGIAVRAIAPFIVSKDKDPAVLVMDEEGKFVISLLAGHIGGANELCIQAAHMLNAVPVITTATDVSAKFAVDTWAVTNNLLIPDISMIKEISSRILNGEMVGLYSDYKVEGKLPLGLTIKKKEAGISISSDAHKYPFAKTLQLIPKNLVLGIGCKRNTCFTKISTAVNLVLSQLELNPERICKICSIDIKQDELGVLKLAELYKIPFQTFTAGELLELEGDFSASAFVQKTTGVDNVCERSAYLGSNFGTCLQKKTAMEGVTVAVYEMDYIVRFE
jgi:cobalt-precorrin 5A hydrolase